MLHHLCKMRAHYVQVDRTESGEGKPVPSCYNRVYPQILLLILILSCHFSLKMPGNFLQFLLINAKDPRFQNHRYQNLQFRFSADIANGYFDNTASKYLQE